MMDGTWQIGGRHGWPPQIKERLALQPGTGMAWKNRKMLACVVRSGTTTILGINGAGHCSSATNSMKKKQYVVYRNGEKERSRGAAPCHWPLCLCGLVSWGPRRSGRRAIIRRPRPHRPRRRADYRSACMLADADAVAVLCTAACILVCSSPQAWFMCPKGLCILDSLYKTYSLVAQFLKPFFLFLSLSVSGRHNSSSRSHNPLFLLAYHLSISPTQYFKLHSITCVSYITKSCFRTPLFTAR